MGRDVLAMYRRIVATAGGEEIWWWYFGTLTVALPGLAPLPVIEAETIMSYRVEPLAGAAFRIHWREIGCFRDIVTGELAERWTNPVTGETVKTPQTFREGPGSYTLTPAGAGLTLAIEQPHAVIESASVAVSDPAPGRICITQTEKKVRGLPQADGTMPKDGLPAETVLSFYAAAADLEQAWAPAQGTYSFVLQGLAPWLGFGAAQGRSEVHGVIAKGSAGYFPNPGAGRRLRALFPTFFDG